MQEVNLFFQTINTSGLTSVNDVTLPEKWYGGTKKFEARLFIGAYNYFPLEDFINHTSKILWNEPDNVQLFIKEQEDLNFRVVELTAQTVEHG